MNNKINISSLVAMLALKSGMTKEKSEIFLKEFFNLISDTLKEGESVKIRSLGTFKTINVETRKSVNVTNGETIIIPEHKRIVFIPSKEIAEVVNAPFSMFEAVELHPDAIKELEEIPAPSDGPAPASAVETVPVNETPAKSEKEEETPPEIKDKEEPEPIIPVKEEAVATIQAQVGSESQIMEEQAGEEVENIAAIKSMSKRRGGMRFMMGFVTGLVVALLLSGLGYWWCISRQAASEKQEPSDKTTETPVAKPTTDTAGAKSEEDTVLVPAQLSETEVTAAEAELPPTQPSDTAPKVIKDVIGPHNYLTTMAQRHYGNFHLWAYIYEENKAFLGHPDRIKPGTEVVVPPLSKYGVDPKNPKDILKAKRLGTEIYDRFK